MDAPTGNLENVLSYFDSCATDEGIFIAVSGTNVNVQRKISKFVIQEDQVAFALEMKKNVE